jgi:adenylate kinase family enzyme
VHVSEDVDSWDQLRRSRHGVESNRSFAIFQTRLGYGPRMRRVLVTGMSGTGKSSALVELGRRGFRVVDTDSAEWSEWTGEEWLWREERMAELLASDGDAPLIVSGCMSNQGTFYDRFDAVVLLSAPADVILARVASRTTNDYGKDAREQDLIRFHLETVEPLLRATCTHELDASRPLAEVVDALAEIAR